MHTLVVVLAVSSLAPFAGATPSVEGCHADAVCLWEGTSGASCDDFASAYTSASVNGVASVTGSYECYPGGGSQSIAVSSAVLNAYWGEFHYEDPKHGQFQSCFIFVGGTYSALPCDVAGPPNPGWGALLP